MLLVALIATGTMKLMCADVSTLAPQYGVQNSSLDEDGLIDILELLVASGDFNTDKDALACSSMLRAQLTNSGDTTLAGVGISNDAFNVLFPNYQDDVRDAFNILLTSSDRDTRQEAADLILLARWAKESLIGWGLMTPDQYTGAAGSLKTDIRRTNAGGMGYGSVIAVEKGQGRSAATVKSIDAAGRIFSKPA